MDCQKNGRVQDSVAHLKQYLGVPHFTVFEAKLRTPPTNSHDIRFSKKTDVAQMEFGGPKIYCLPHISPANCR